MEKLIACCGLDCSVCDARNATIQNDDDLRKATAEKWQKMYNAPDITPETINCTGCRVEGVKFSHCLQCEIRKCADTKGYVTCGECPELDGCQIVAGVHKFMPEALQNLKHLN
ncbi:MAG: DUF3795 domain-containing protein [Bacteroidales bacterium]|jgi:hypothetical protein|nr:DUF3795 domain-containing protein [Bacteroidales bacterium]